MNSHTELKLPVCLWAKRARGPFLESPCNFSGLKMGARVLASKLLHFVPLTDGFIMLDAKLLKPRSLLIIIIGTFEKRAPAPLTRLAKFQTKCISNHDLRHNGPI